MLGLMILLAGVVGVAAFGLLDGSDEVPEEAVDGADLGEKAALLDDAEVTRLDAALEDDPLLAQGEVGPEGEALVPYEGEDGFGDVPGTDGPDLIELDEDVGSQGNPPFGEGGNDVILGNSGDNVADGGDDDDIIFGRGGFDQLFGGDGSDTIAGGDGGDLLTGGRGSDVMYGGAGDDNIHDTGLGVTDRADRVDVISAGAGDDGVVIENGINLVSLGEGNDHVMVYSTQAGNPAAVITDFDPREDALLLGVHAPDVALPKGANGIELGYSLRLIETDLGPATLVQPEGTEDLTADDLGAGASVGYAVLVGITPEDLDGATIRVVLNTPDTNVFEAGSVEQVAQAMGATRI